ncbi:MAG: transglycosylase SLT domain-containing protein [Myxococcales bacterium]
MAALSDGRYEEVLALLSSETSALTPEASYLRARALAELGKPDQALDTFPRTPDSWPARVQADVRALRVQWAAGAGRCAALEEEVKSAAPKSSASTQATRLLGRCLYAAGDLARAATLLADATDPSSRGMRVRALVSLGNQAEALPLAHALYIEHPAHAEAKYCLSVLEGAGPLRLSVDEHLRRAEELLAARQPELAHQELASLDKQTPAKLRARLWHLRGDALFRTRKRYPEAERAFAQAAKLEGDTEAYDAFHAIRSASRAGKDAQAIKRYRAYAKKYPKSSLTPDALYLSAWLSAREKRASARDALKTFVSSDEAKRAPGLRRDATWDLAWLAFERGDALDAARWLDECARLADKPLWAARVSYWQGRTALLGRDPKRAKQAFTETLSKDRLGYYAQLAARRLVALGEPPPQAFDATTPLPSMPTLAPPPEVMFYRALGLNAEASEAGKAWLETQPDRYARIAALSATGDAAQTYSAAEPLMGDILARAPTPAERWLWEALLPRPYATSVSESTAQQDLPSALFYGHMQVESRYKPRAVSGADALGLMQLLPSTAAAVASGLKIPADRASLMRPYVNVALGARYLSGLVTRYRGQYPLAIAAYNAGTQRIDSSLGAVPGKKSKSTERPASGEEPEDEERTPPVGTGKVELDSWVERISVEQTRNYVRRVLGAYSRYHALENPDAPWDLPLGEHVSLRTE